MMKIYMFLYSYMLMLTPVIIMFFLITLLMNPMKNKFHPIILMIILILMIFLISLLMNLIYYSLMSFILFLAMIGGLMIIYMYITSLTNNEFFFMNLKSIIFNMIKIFPLILMIIMLMYLYLPSNYLNLNSQDLWKINLFQFNYDQININNIYNKINNKSSIFIMLYIYYTMICIMNICYKLKSPLRQLMN